MRKIICLLLSTILLMFLYVPVMAVAETIEQPRLVFGKTFSADWSNGYAIKQDGSLWMWGDTSYDTIPFDYAGLPDDWDEWSAYYDDWHARNEHIIRYSPPAKQDDEVISVSGHEILKADRITNFAENKLDNVIDIAAGSAFRAFVQENGAMWFYTMGRNDMKKMDSGAKKVFLHDDSCFILKEDGSLWHVGFHTTIFGDLCPEWAIYYASNPIKIMDNAIWAVHDGFTAFVVDGNGTLWGWEDNQYGQILAITHPGMKQPVRIMEDVAQVDCRYNWVAVIKKDGSLWTWGANNEDGDLGHGTTEDQYTPTKIMDNVVSVEINRRAQLALKADGTLWAWGSMPHYTYPDDPENKRLHLSPEKIMDGVAIPGTPAHFPSAWAKEEVSQAKEACLVPVNLQSWYQSNITRVEFASLAATMIEKASGQPLDEFVKIHATANSVTFSDTSDKNILALAALGIVNGVGDGRFAPERTITREEAARLLRNTAVVLELPEPVKTQSFTDGGQISDWAKEGIAYVSGYGVMNGTGQGQFSPKANYTREMSILTFWRLYQVLTIE